MPRAVKLVHFTQEIESPLCAITRITLEQLAELADRLTLEVHDLQRDVPVVAAHDVDMIPATVIEGTHGRGIRILGLPAGYVLAELLETILTVSRNRSELQPATTAALRTLERRVHLQVFVSSTCQFCPVAVRLATRFALESDLVRTDVVDVFGFPHLVQRFAVRSVPRTVVDGLNAIEGILPEDAYLARFLGRRAVAAAR